MTHNEITPRVAKDIARQSHRAGCDRLLSLLHSRTEKGIQEYGRPLRTGDNQPWLRHLIEELADSLQYTQGALMDDPTLEGCDRAKLQRAYSTLIEIALDIEEIRMKRGEGDRPLITPEFLESEGWDYVENCTRGEFVLTCDRCEDIEDYTVDVDCDDPAIVPSIWIPFAGGQHWCNHSGGGTQSAYSLIEKWKAAQQQLNLLEGDRP